MGKQRRERRKQLGGVPSGYPTSKSVIFLTDIIPNGKANYYDQMKVEVLYVGGLTVVEDTGVGQQQRDQLGVLVQLHGVLALVGEQCANVNGKVHFVG